MNRKQDKRGLRSRRVAGAAALSACLLGTLVAVEAARRCRRCPPGREGLHRPAPRPGNGELPCPRRAP